MKIGDHEIGVPVPVEVSGVDAHAGPGHPLRVEGHVGLETHFFESSVLPVEQEQIGRGVSGDQQVLPAVAVGIDAHHSKGPALVPVNSRSLADVLKGAVAPVAIEPGPARKVGLLIAIGGNPLVIAGDGVGE